jgi:hypothetical protein
MSGYVTTLGVLLTEADADLVRRRASAAERTVSQELRFALRSYLQTEPPASSSTAEGSKTGERPADASSEYR